MIFFSMGVGGDRVELAGGKMNVLSCLRWLSHVLLLRTWPQSAWCVDYFLATFCPVLAGFTASSDNLSPQGIWKTFPLFFFLPPPYVLLLLQLYYCTMLSHMRSSQFFLCRTHSSTRQCCQILSHLSHATRLFEWHRDVLWVKRRYGFPLLFVFSDYSSTVRTDWYYVLISGGILSASFVSAVVSLFESAI